MIPHQKTQSLIVARVAVAAPLTAAGRLTGGAGVRWKYTLKGPLSLWTDTRHQSSSSSGGAAAGTADIRRWIDR